MTLLNTLDLTHPIVQAPMAGAAHLSWQRLSVILADWVHWGPA